MEAEFPHLKLNTCMYDIFLPIGEAKLDAWRSHRLFSACRTFAHHVDPDMTAQAKYEDHARQGWTFWLTSEQARDNLRIFYEHLVGRVLAEASSRHHPVEVGGHDAATAIYQG